MLTRRSSLLLGALIGFALGGFVGLLFRPAAFIAGQLPLQHVLSRGSTLQGLDQMLVPLAQQSFNIAFGCAIVGAALGFMISLFICRHYSNDSESSLTFSTEWAGFALSLLTFVGVFLPLVVLNNVPGQSGGGIISIFSLGIFVTLLALLLSIGIGLCWISNQPEGVMPLSMLLLMIVFIVLFVEAGRISTASNFSLSNHISAGFYFIIIGTIGGFLLSLWKITFQDAQPSS